MKALRVVVPVVIGLVLVLAITTRIVRQSDAHEYFAQHEAIRREMADRSAVARGVAGPAGIEEARAVLRWWTESLAELRKRHPRPSSRDERAIEQRAHAARVTLGDDAAPGFRYADGRVAVLRQGYSPVLTAADQGVRLDILAIAAGEHPDTHERALRIDFALWGVPRRFDREPSVEGRPSSTRVVVPLSFRSIRFRFIDAAGNTYGEMVGTGEPYLVLKDPERFSSDLPPGIALGTWWVDPFPREATRVELTIGVQIQGMTSAALAPTFHWEVPVPDEWKLRPGEPYRAEPRTASPDAADRR